MPEGMPWITATVTSAGCNLPARFGCVLIFLATYVAAHSFFGLPVHREAAASLLSATSFSDSSQQPVQYATATAKSSLHAAVTATSPQRYHFAPDPLHRGPTAAVPTSLQYNNAQQHRRLLQQQQQPQQQQQTPAQRAYAAWHERQQQQQEAASEAGVPSGTSVGAPSHDAAAAPGEFTIPVPPPGTDIPMEVQIPLYSPDQLRVRHKLIAGVPQESQIISLGEQLQQAAALGVTLTPQQLENANPLLGPRGPVKVPEPADPSDFPDGYVAICVIVKDQHQDITEWLEYHRWLGIKKVYVYDNNSTTPLSAHIHDFMHSGYVEYNFFTGMQRYRDLFRTSSQWWAYNDCVRRFRNRHRWLAFIDADEFIVLKEAKYDRPSWQQQQQQAETDLLAAGHEIGPGSTQGNLDINTFMQQYDQYGGLALNWVIFGSSNYTSRPPGGVLVNYHACLPSQHEQNTHVKVVANTKHLLTIGDDPHRVYYSSADHYTVNELGEKVTHARTTLPSHTKVALYHYLTKSEREYMLKMRRGSAAGNYKSPEFFHTINQFATHTCTGAVPLGLKCCPSVLEELGQRGVLAVQQKLAALQHTSQQQHELSTDHMLR